MGNWGGIEGEVPGQRREERGPEWGAAALSARVWDWGYEFFKAVEFGFRVREASDDKGSAEPGLTSAGLDLHFLTCF